MSSQYERDTHIFDPWVVGFSIASIVNSAATALIIAMGSQPWLSPVLAIGLGMASLIMYAVEHRTSVYRRRQSDDKDMQFCVGCGKKMTLFERQTSFDPKTGKPVMEAALACPSKSSSGVFMGMGMSDRFCDFNREQRAKPARHTCGGVTSTGCNGCLSDMFAEGAIDSETFQRLLEAA